MSAFAWSQAMSVGVPALDADHRCLVRIISLLQDVEAEESQRVIDMVLDTLVVYGRYHFAREEQVMRGCGFPALDFHQREHRDFTRFIAGLRGQAETKQGRTAAQALLEYLITWLRHHILIQDMAYKPYVGDVQAAESLARQAGTDMPELIRQQPPAEACLQA